MPEYKTKDIFEASWIYSQKAPLLRLDPDGNYFWFVFANDENFTSSLSEKYWRQTATGNIKEYVNSLKSLKDLIFSQKHNY